MMFLIKYLLIAGLAKVGNARLLRSQLGATEGDQSHPKPEIMPIKPTKSSSGVFATTTKTLPYGGGPVMLGTINMYYIWYGNWSGLNPGAIPLLENFAKNIGGSPYWNIQSTYYQKSGTKMNYMSNSVAFKGSVNYTQFSSSLSQSDIANIVYNTVTAAKLPLDPNGLYFVLTASDINVDNGAFCGSYCGWHTYQYFSGQYIKYSFVGDSNRCPSACAAQSPGPNGNTGADGMVSVIAHELEETATDPLLNAWTGPSGENGDMCAWTFGTTQGAAGRQYNMNLGGTNYLIQQNFILTDVNGTGYCGLSYQPPAPTTHSPSQAPNTNPTNQPTISPTKQPTFLPTNKPSPLPTNKPSTKPPTLKPTAKPSTKPPTLQPTTSTPTRKPSTSSPTKLPTSVPTSKPTPQPSLQPTFAPSSAPV